jgi:hypothetical protein
LLDRLQSSSGEKAEIFPDPNFNTNQILESAFSNAGNPIIAFDSVSDDDNRSWSNDNAAAFAKWIVENTNYNIIEFGLTPVLDESSRVFHPFGTLSLSNKPPSCRKQVSSLLLTADFLTLQKQCIDDVSY